MFLPVGGEFFFTSSGSCSRRQRLRIAIATARLAAVCPTMYLSNSATICLGVKSVIYASQRKCSRTAILQRNNSTPLSGCYTIPAIKAGLTDRLCEIEVLIVLTDSRFGTIPSVKRRLFNVLAGVSLVMCVATVTLWVRSYYRSDRAEWITGRGQMYAVESEAGAIYVPLYNAGSRWDHWNISLSSYTLGPDEGWQNTRAAWAGITVFKSGEANILTLSYWLLMALGILFCAVSWRSARAIDPNFDHCKRCGCDLRATPDRCPECGEVPKITA
jgi:hypothetical protein